MDVKGEVFIFIWEESELSSYNKFTGINGVEYNE